MCNSSDNPLNCYRIQPLEIASRWAGYLQPLHFITVSAVNAQTYLNCYLYVSYINSVPRIHRFLHLKILRNSSAESYRHCSHIRYLAVGRVEQAGKSACKEAYCHCGHNHNPCRGHGHDLYRSHSYSRHYCSRFRKYRTHYSCCRSSTTKVKSISNCSSL